MGTLTVPSQKLMSKHLMSKTTASVHPSHRSRNIITATHLDHTFFLTAWKAYYVPGSAETVHSHRKWVEIHFTPLQLSQVT